MTIHCINLTANNPKVGIFWLIPTNKVVAGNITDDCTLLYLAQDITTAEHFEKYYSSAADHYTVWIAVQHSFSQLKHTPYEKYPRGRVTFVSDDYPHTGTFKLMADIKILCLPKCLAELKRLYNITSRYGVDLMRDLHYRTK